MVVESWYYFNTLSKLRHNALICTWLDGLNIKTKNVYGIKHGRNNCDEFRQEN